MATFLAMVRFWYPNEGALSILEMAKENMCVGCPIAVAPVAPAPTMELAGISADFTIAEGLLYGDLAVITTGDLTPIPMNGEADPDYCEGHFEGPNYNVEGIAELTIDMQTFVSGADQTVFGVVISKDTGGDPVIFGVARFDAPIVLASGDNLKVVGFLRVPASVPGDEV